MMPDSLRDLWEGPHWRWIALGTGVLLVAVSLLVAAGISLVRAGEWASLALLLLLIELFVLGVVGSGMLDGLAGRAIAGGMARQPLPDSRTTPAPAPTLAEQRRRDRKTLRFGLIALPVFMTFLVLLFR